MFKLASLIVEIVAETSSLDRALSRTHANLTTANVALGTFAGNVAASFARMAVQSAEGLFEATVRSASHLTESVNKANVLFGDSAKIITGHAQTMADMWSEPKQAVMDMTNKFALMGREIGYSKEQAAEFGVKVSKMALDARSLGDAETAALKIEAALAGQSKPLRSLGVFINAATVKAEAARMGLKPEESTGQLSEGSKIKARMSLIENSEFMRKAAGDLARTFKETEGQTRAFWGALSNLGTSIGEQLNPAWNKLLIDINSGMGSLKSYFEANKSVIKSWGDKVVEGVNAAKVVWRNLPDVLEIALLGADQKMEDARAKIEAWATKIAVSIESVFLKTAQKAGDLIKKTQNLSQGNIIAPTAGFLSDAMSGGKSLFEGVSNWWDKGVSRDAKRANFLLTPLRDLNNFLERQEGVTEGHEQSVEDRVNRLQGIFSGPGKLMGRISDYFKTFQDVAQIASTEKPKDFTSGLIDRANKHLAETLTQNTDVSSKAIAAAQARIAKREVTRLDEADSKKKEKTDADRKNKELENIATDAKDMLESMGLHPREFPRLAERSKLDAAAREKLDKEIEKQDFLQSLGLKGFAKLKAMRPGGEDGKGAAGEDKDVAMKKSKHEKSITDTMSFMASLQAGQLGGDVQDKQLTELQKIREADEKNAAMMEKMLTRGVGAVFG